MKWNGGFVVNKAKVYCVASAVAVCVASNPSMDVLAKHLQPVKLEEKAQQTISAEDYIKYYLSTKEIVKDLNNKDIEKYTLITKVDEKNCTIVLTGNQLFKELTKENQDEIKNAYETAYKNAGMIKAKNCTLSAYDLIVSQASIMVQDAKEQLSLLVKDAESLDVSSYTASTYASLKTEMDESKNLIALDTTTLEQVVEEQVKLVNAKKALIDLSGLKSAVEQSNYVKDDYTKNSYRTYETALNQAKAVLDNANSTTEEIQKAQEDLSSAINAMVKKADFSALNEKVQEGYAFLESDKDMLEEASYTNFKNELDACSVILSNDESTQDEINNALAKLNAYFENNENFVYKVMTLENNVVVQPQKQLLDTPQLVVQEQVNTVQQLQTTSPKATTSAADNFIKTYLTSASGNIFTTANYLNYQKILSAMPSWLKLSSQDQKAVNAELKNQVGKTYQKLLQESQNLKMSSGRSINTATNTDSTLYTWLCVMSLGMLTFVTKRLRKQD